MLVCPCVYGGKGRGSQVWCAMVARDVDRRYGVQWWQGTWIAGMVYNGGKGRGSQVWCAMVARDVDRRYGVQGTWEGG